MTTPTWLAGAGWMALSGAVTLLIAGFKNVVQFFKNLQHILLVEEELVFNQDLMKRLLNCRRGNWRPHYWTANYLYDGRVAHFRQIQAEHAPATATVLWGWRPLTYTYENGRIRLHYLRGLFKRDYFAGICQRSLDEEIESMMTRTQDQGALGCNSRFNVMRITGNRGRTLRSRASEGDNRDYAEPAGLSKPSNPMVEGMKAFASPTAAYDELLIACANIPFADRKLLSTNGPRFNSDNYFLCPSLTAAKAEMEHWLRLSHWYSQRGVIWKRGWLLTGIPGSGKTSFVKYLAEFYGLPLISLDLTSMTNEDLNSCWNKARGNAPCIVLMEDIDAVFKGRENITNGQDMAPGVSFDALLNLLDGVTDNNGIFTIITTNHPENLDPALAGSEENSAAITSRPGRIDRVIEVGCATPDVKLKIAGKILSQWPEMVGDAINEGPYDTAAQMQERCVRKALAKLWEAIPATTKD